MRDGSEVECGCGCGCDDAGARALESDPSDCSTSCHSSHLLPDSGELQTGSRESRGWSRSPCDSLLLLPRRGLSLTAIRYTWMKSDERGYHQAKIAFVSDLEGGSVSHINLVCATALVRPLPPPRSATLAPPPLTAAAAAAAAAAASPRMPCGSLSTTDGSEGEGRRRSEATRSRSLSPRGPS